MTATTVAVLGTPVMRAATSNDPNSLTISWNAVGGATGYEVFRKAEGEQDWSRMAETSGLYATSYVDHSVVCGKAYSYTVRACCEKTETASMAHMIRRALLGELFRRHRRSRHPAIPLPAFLCHGQRCPAQMAIIFIERQMPMARGHMSIPSGRTIPAIRTPV